MRKISKKSVTLWRIRLFAAAVICALVTSLGFVPYSTLWNICTALWIAAFLTLYFFYYPLKYKNLCYFVDQSGHLCVKGGVVYRFERFMDVKNIQYVNFISDPIQKLMGLRGAVVLAPGSRIYIPCLDEEGSKELLKMIGR